MVKQPNDLEYDLFSDRNQNKYFVFEQVREFLDSNGIFWEHLFQLFRKSEYGYLRYSFGDVEISFTRTGAFNEETDDLEDEIELSVESNRGNLSRKLTYEYKMKELSEWKKMRQSEIGNFGE
jgi:hypothetical protein